MVMHYRFTEGTAAIRGANDASSLMPDVFPVVVSRTIPKGFGPDQSLTVSKDLATATQAIYTHREAISWVCPP
jgi:hypothetical protein